MKLAEINTEIDRHFRAVGILNFSLDKLNSAALRMQEDIKTILLRLKELDSEVPEDPEAEAVAEKS